VRGASGLPGRTHANLGRCSAPADHPARATSAADPTRPAAGAAAASTDDPASDAARAASGVTLGA
jgi:hypothetical protein